MSETYEFDPTVFSNIRKSKDELTEIARIIRTDIVKSLAMAGSGHSGGPLGSADIFAVLYFNGILNYNPNDPTMQERDRFVLSAGHMCPVLYSSLARAGFFPVEELKTLRKFGTRLQGHPALDKGLPGIETSSGSLGQGISIAVGMAMSDKLVDKNSAKVVCLTGDGELQEGEVWEAAMSAAAFKLDNLLWIVDNNDCQIDGRVKDVMSIYPLEEKFLSFGFEVISCDGNNIDDLIQAFDAFNDNFKRKIGKPTVIIARTKMGKGVSFMEDLYKWHGNPPNHAQAETALSELI